MTGERLPRPARRAQIVAAAATAFLSRGYDGTSMEDVATAAGVTRLVVYRIFETKHELYQAVLASATDDLAAEFRDTDIFAVRERGGIVPLMLIVARRHPDAFRLLWRHADHEPEFAVFSQRFRAVLADFAEAVIDVSATGAPIHGPVMRHWCATVLVEHLLGGVCAWLDVGDPCHDESFVVALTCGLLALIEAWSEPRPPPWLTS